MIILEPRQPVTLSAIDRANWAIVSHLGGRRFARVYLCKSLGTSFLSIVTPTLARDVLIKMLQL